MGGCDKGYLEVIQEGADDVGGELPSSLGPCSASFRCMAWPRMRLSLWKPTIAPVVEVRTGINSGWGWPVTMYSFVDDGSHQWCVLGVLSPFVSDECRGRQKMGGEFSRAVAGAQRGDLEYALVLSGPVRGGVGVD